MDNLPNDANKITIINPNVKIENKKIKGDIYISPDANGQVEIKNTIIQGQVLISGIIRNLAPGDYTLVIEKKRFRNIKMQNGNRYLR